jgi:hypothetical protein
MDSTFRPKFLIALPIFAGAKGFCHKTVLVSARNKEDAVIRAIGILDKKYKRKRQINIGDIKRVKY